MIKVLIIGFVLLSLLAGGDRTAKSLMTTAINVTIFAVLIELIYRVYNDHRCYYNYGYDSFLPE